MNSQSEQALLSIKPSSFLSEISVQLSQRKQKDAPLHGKFELAQREDGLREALVWSFVQGNGEWATSNDNAYTIIMARPALVNGTELEWSRKLDDANLAIEDARQRMLESGFRLDPALLKKAE